MTDSITLTFTNYHIKGVATIELWGGGIGNIKMDEITTDTIDNLSIETLNDGGFGCQQILGGFVYIYKNYEGYEVFQDSLVIGDFKAIEEN